MAPLAQASKLADDPQFAYDVRFTNPVCTQYNYSSPVTAVDGTTQLTHKPLNVFCTASDAAASASRPESPQYKLLEWINDPTTTEITFMYLSFSNKTVEKALCDRAKNGVKIKFVVDSSPGNADGASTDLKNCAPDNVQLEVRGHEPLLANGTEGADTIGFAHNKMFVINPNSPDKIRMAFSSGNLSSGTVLHHENWHFITTSPKSYFWQAHRCAIDGVFNHHAAISDYTEYMKTCRAAITVPEEDDIKVFFSPAEGDRAAKVMTDAIAASNSISIGAHRFSFNKMIAALKKRIADGQSGLKPALDLRIVADDDTYWVGKNDLAGLTVDPLPPEYANIMGLVSAGAKVRWMETNQWQHMLHHSKFLLFDDRAVFCGAGNLTGTGFRANFENYYYITIPSVVQAFRKQYEHVWNDLATPPSLMPSSDVMPIGADGSH